MPTSISLCVIFLTLVVARASFSENSRKMIELREEGYKSYKSLVEKSEEECWKKAVRRLNVTCNMSEIHQGKLAIEFTNCFLRMSDDETYDCGERRNVKECIKELKKSPVDYQIYAMFFIHTKQACFFLRR